MSMFYEPDLPLIASQSLATMPDSDKAIFMNEFMRRKRTTGLAYLLWFLGFHYAYFKNWTLLVLFWISCFLVVGIIWWIIDAFRIPSMRQSYNQDQALAILKDMKALNAPTAAT